MKTGSMRFNRLDALSLWHRVTLECVIDDAPDLTSRQFAILTSIYLHKGPHTVRSLAKTLNVTKAVITRGIDTLSRYGFVERVPDPRDRRSVIIKRTGPGATYLTNFADQIRAELKLSVVKTIAA